MKRVILILCTSFLYSCSSSSSDDGSTGRNPNDGIWSIPISQVLDGGPGRDGIPALVNPGFTDVSAAGYLNDLDLVIGFKKGNDVRAYPHAILDWHEIANDKIGDVSLAVTYCPLTGTGIGWNRVINGKETTFGVSGLLYNTNLIAFDRETDSNWAQLLNEAVNGELIGKEAELIMLFETNWGTWKKLYPQSKVLSTQTGFSRTYGISPYGDYSTNNNRFLFPVPKDDRLPSKERVHAIVGETNAITYRFPHFISTNIIRDTFQGKNYLIVGNEDFIVSFELTGALNNLEFEFIYAETEVLLEDNQGTRYNIFGEAISGPGLGNNLGSSPGFMGYWFSIPAFYQTEIYSG